MLLLLVIAFLATPAFFLNAKRHNCHPGRAASLPFLSLGVLLVTDHVFSPLLAAVTSSIVTSTTINMVILYGYNLFLICIYLIFISRNWTALSRVESETTLDV